MYKKLSALIVLSLLFLSFLLPLFLLFISSLSGEKIIEVFKDPVSYKILCFTLKESLISALLSVLVALLFSSFFSHYTFPGRRAVITLSEISFTIPTILVVLGFVIWYGRTGYLNFLLSRVLPNYRPIKFLYSFKSIILAHFYLNFPLSFALITSAWSSLPDNEEKASYSLGRGKIYTFFKITLFKLKGTISSSFCLVFLYCFTSFVIVMTLGGNVSFSTLESEIYKRVHIGANLESAASLSLFSLFFVSLVLFITTKMRGEGKLPRSEKVLKKARGKTLLLSFLLSLLLLLFLLPPMLSIVYRSFFLNDKTFTLSVWKNLFGGAYGPLKTALRAIISTILLALFSSLLSVKASTALSLYGAKKNVKLVSLVSSFPLAVGSVTLGLSFLYLSSKVNVRSDSLVYFFVLVSHVVITLPLSTRIILAEAKKIPANLCYASYALGKSERETVRKVERPLLRNAVRKAFSFSFALSLGEVNATLTLSGGSVTTLPVLLYRLINTYNYSAAAALGTILLFLSLIAFSFGDKDGIS